MNNKFSKTVIVGIRLESLDDRYWKMIDALTDKKVFVDKNDSAKINKEINDADCVLLAFGVPFTKEHLDMSKNLKFIGILATAYGKVDISYAKSKGIPVCTVPGYSTESVAEFTIAAILEVIRGLEEGKKRGKSGDYSESGIRAWEIKDKTFGVLGLGSIGRRVAEIAQGFGANVIYWSKNKKEDAHKRGINFSEIDDLLKESDFISLNLAQTKDTEGFLNGERISKIKSNAVIINTAPMEIVDVKALSNRLGKKDMIFILDHSDEMSKENMAVLSEHTNCIIYPPIAYITDEARTSKQRIFVDNINNFLLGKEIKRVN